MAVGDPTIHPDAQATSDEIHFRKNRPEQPDIVFPPYVYRPYPMAMYRKNDEGEIVSILVGIEDHPPNAVVNPQLRARNDREQAEKAAQGWATSPGGVKDAQEVVRAAVRQAAAERAFDDRHLGEQARAELEAAEDASEDHVLDVPAPKKKPGRPAKAKES